MVLSRIMVKRRALVAVVALYGLLLQAFLAGFAPVPAFATAGHAEICAPIADTDEAAGHPVGGARHECCLAACAAAATALPALDAASIAVDWPERASTRIARFGRDVPQATGPPRSALHARGPPSA